MRTFILTFLLFLNVTFLATAQTEPGTVSGKKQEIRATWITTLGGMDWPRSKAGSAAGIRRQQQEFCQLLDRLKAAHFNTVLLQTRLRGDLIYPSRFETFCEALTGHTGRHPGYDPLAFAIEACHQRGMELHAWVVTIPVGNVRQVKLQGSRSVVHQHRNLCKSYKGNWYLDPGNPGTEEYLAALVQELVTRYDIDGIHFDYIRYPEQAEQFPDRDTFRRYGKGLSLKTWRRDNLTRIVRRLYTDIKAVKPWVKVSSSPVGKYRDTRRYPSRGWNAYDAVYQEAQQWLQEGIHDALFPMMYFKGNQFYPFALDWKEQAAGRWIVPGLGIYFLSPREQDWPLDEIVRQIHFTRQIGLHGQAYFRNRFLLDNTKGIFDELEESTYPTWAIVPPMTWVDSIPPSAPTRPVLQRTSDDRLVLKWEKPEESGASEVLYYHLYGSNQYPVDTSLAANLLAIRLQETCFVYQAPVAWREPRYFAVTATDRFGNESEPLALNQPAEGELCLLNQGDELILPPETHFRLLILRNAHGEEVMRSRYLPNLSLTRLASGFYTVYGIDSLGAEMLLGMAVK